MIQIYEKDLKILFEPITLKRGKEYFLDDRVIAYKEEHDAIEAIVSGTDDYDVSIDLNDMQMKCDCPAFESWGNCKHLAAVLFARLNRQKIGNPAVEQPSQGSAGLTAIRPCVNLRSILESKSKDELLGLLSELGNSYPAIQKLLQIAYGSSGELDYKALERYITKKITGVTGYSYRNSHKEFQTASREILVIFKFLPSTEKTFEYYLRQAYMLQALASQNSSYNIVLCNMSNIILELSIPIMDKIGIKCLEIILEYCRNESTGLYGLDLISFIINNSNNLEIKNALTDKLERTRSRKDSDFYFDRISGLEILLSYYRANDPQMFEELACELLDSSKEAKVGYIDCLINKRRYDEVLKIAAKFISQEGIENQVEAALTALNEREKLIEFYIDSLSDQIDRRKIKQLQLLMEPTDRDGWNKYISVYLKGIWNIEDRFSLMLFLEKYDELLVALTAFHAAQPIRSGNLIDDYAGKFVTIDKSIAIKLYRLLLQTEVDNLNSSSHYSSFKSIWRELKKLDDTRFLSETKSFLIKKYYTKRKLTQFLYGEP